MSKASTTRSGKKYKAEDKKKAFDSKTTTIKGGKVVIKETADTNKEVDPDEKKYIDGHGNWVEPPTDASKDVLMEYMEARNRLDTKYPNLLWVVNKHSKLERISIMDLKHEDPYPIKCVGKMLGHQWDGQLKALHKFKISDLLESIQCNLYGTTGLVSYDAHRALVYGENGKVVFEIKGVDKIKGWSRQSIGSSVLVPCSRLIVEF